MSVRSERVGDEVREALARALLTDVSDPRLSSVSISAVLPSRDVRFARVYWSVIGTEPPDEDEIAAVGASLDRAKGFLRRYLGQHVRLRFVPELAFVYDESLDRGRKLDDLIRAIDVPSEDVVDVPSEE